MRILIALLVLAIPLRAYQTPSTGSKNSSSNYTAQTTHQAYKGLDSSSLRAVDKPADARPRENAEQQETSRPPGDPPKWVDFLNAISTAVIAAFTVLLFAAVIWQTKTTRDLERAWITANLEFWERGRLHIVNYDAAEHGIKKESVTVHLKLTCKNRGRSLARIDDILGRSDVGSKPTEGKPTESSLANLGEMGALQADSEAFRGIELTCEGRHREGTWVFVYVLIKYRDIFGKHRETSLGYVILDANNIYPQTPAVGRNTNT